MKGWLAIGVAGLAAVAAAQSPPRQGGLVLQFDDGWSQWRTVTAPELERVGGKATAFVNNQYLDNGRITFGDLRALQDRYGWEIGTHTYTHQNAVRFVQQHGLEAWLNGQLDRAIASLDQAGLRVHHLVFPFNACTPELAAAALKRVDSYRRTDDLAIASGRRTDGSVPGTSIDLTRFVPVRLLQQWVDAAQQQNRLLFLYGHRILPDEAFVTGRVVAVTADSIETGGPVVLPQDNDLVLVPDTSRRGQVDSLRGLTVEGNRIRVAPGSPDLTRLTAPGAEFLIGPSYGTRMSDFRALIEYAAPRLNFYTLTEALRARPPEARTPAAVSAGGSP